MSHPFLFFLIFQNYKRQAVAALGLFVRMAGHCDISEETNTAPLLINLWNLTNKHSVLDKKLLVRIIDDGSYSRVYNSLNKQIKSVIKLKNGI